jgi:agmatine deiminase
MHKRLPAEWEEQDAVLLAWPHMDSDWCEDLALVEPVFVTIVQAVARFQRVLIVAPETTTIEEQLRRAGVELKRVSLYALPTNDTWARDFGPITIFEEGEPVLCDFGFNGWGLKFAAHFDNRITAELACLGAFGKRRVSVPGLILEGGSIESDGEGTLLTTSQCLLEANRNPHLSRAELEEKLAELFGVDHVLWLEHGYLAGDDTDSHIDTLARLAPDNTILYVKCTDEQDEHYRALAAMEAELRALRPRIGRRFRLLPLPWPQACFDREGGRLPATYANFLVINGAVLVPTYDDPADAEACAVVARAFPGREIVAIDCRALILQHGSLHCVTMQLPRGVPA